MPADRKSLGNDSKSGKGREPVRQRKKKKARKYRPRARKHTCREHDVIASVNSVVVLEGRILPAEGREKERRPQPLPARVRPFFVLAKTLCQFFYCTCTQVPRLHVSATIYNTNLC